MGGAGRLLAGRYRVVARLGRGGMGVVWRAVDEVLGREVAVKELRTYTDAAGPELSELRVRMQREARAAARVRHPGVVAVHDIAEVDGRPLIVMELVDGPSLDDVLRERGTMDPYETARIGAEVMDALAAAHRAGVLHRDVKPGNILLDRSGRVVLTDFGIATMDDPGDGSATHLTRSGELVGSLDYLAPERAQGADPGPASDVWALGATLYAAVEGSSPFRRTSTYSTLTAIVADPLPEPRRAGPLAPVLQRLLDKRPDGRPDAEEARELLRETAATRPPDSPTAALRAAPARGPEPTERSVPQRPPGFGPPAMGHGVPPTHAVGEGLPAGQASRTHAAGEGSVAGQPTYAVGQGSAAEEGSRTHAVGQGSAAEEGSRTHAVVSGSPGGQVPQAYGRGGAGAPYAGAPTSPMGTPTAAPRRKGRALLAAVAVTVVLAVVGVTVALLNNKGESESDAAPAGSRTEAGATGRADTEWSAQPKPSGRGTGKSAAPSAKASRASGDQPSHRASASAPAKASSSPTRGGGTPGGGTGGTTGAAPACQPIGGGKYNCQVWRAAKSYTASGAEAGVLDAGTNYFFCQTNLGRRETYGRWTNVWWARTDDDSGNTGVYVSDVYLKGGGNDEPVPGLPAC
ncbi:protein kinase [Streptomyces sp. NPDC005728]|uniref:serine/threonine-protein kinase n=1 Tax=Streptomyces sp. NPDC005728 TaxID=3157054 RepID=UPI003403A958